MNIITCYFTTLEVVNWMLEHNDGLTIKNPPDSCPHLIISKKPIEELSFPDGWYYNDKNGLTNKYNSTTGIYHCIEIVLQS